MVLRFRYELWVLAQLQGNHRMVGGPNYFRVNYFDVLCSTQHGSTGKCNEMLSFSKFM